MTDKEKIDLVEYMEANHKGLLEILKQDLYNMVH